MSNMKFNEEKLIAIAKPYMLRARSGDWRHALRVVKYVKKLAKDKSDLYLHVTAAYIHDIGWSGVAPKGKLDFQKMLTLEPQANKNSKKLVTKVLKKLNYNSAEVKIVNRLIAAADAHKSSSKDEVFIVDADNLSKLCVGHIKEKYKPESYKKIIFMLETELVKRIQTEQGKRMYPGLLKRVKQKIGA